MLEKVCMELLKLTGTDVVAERWEGKVKFTIDAIEKLGFIVSEKEIILFSGDAQNHLLQKNYAGTEEWTADAYRQMQKFLDHTIRFTYFYRGQKLVRYTVSDCRSGQEIANVKMAWEALYLFGKAERYIKEVYFMHRI